MVALNRSGISKLGFNYPGFIAVCKLRYGYGHQELIEKIEILDNWYSNLNAFLPVVFSGKERETFAEKKYTFGAAEQKVSLSDLLDKAGDDVDKLWEVYDPLFEGASMDPTERQFIRNLKSIKRQLDIVTAESKIMDGVKMEDVQGMLAG